MAFYSLVLSASETKLMILVIIIIIILGSCLATNLRYSVCCILSRTQECISLDCHCDQSCYINNDCCSDISDIGCHPVSSSSFTVSPTSTNTLGKKNSEAPYFIL